MARPERFELPTPWFVAKRARVTNCFYLLFGRGARCNLHNSALPRTTESGKNPAVTIAAQIGRHGVELRNALRSTDLCISAFPVYP